MVEGQKSQTRKRSAGQSSFYSSRWEQNLFEHSGSINYTVSYHTIMCYFFSSCGTLPVLRLQFRKGQLVAVPACMRHNCFTSIILFWWKAKIVTDMENCLIPQSYFMDYTSGMRNYSAKKLFSWHCKRDVIAIPWRDPLTLSQI